MYPDVLMRLYRSLPVGRQTFSIRLPSCQESLPSVIPFEKLYPDLIPCDKRGQNKCWSSTAQVWARFGIPMDDVQFPWENLSQTGEKVKTGNTRCICIYSFTANIIVPRRRPSNANLEIRPTSNLGLRATYIHVCT